MWREIHSGGTLKKRVFPARNISFWVSWRFSFLKIPRHGALQPEFSPLVRIPLPAGAAAAFSRQFLPEAA
jgi:hypothetical protein